MSLVSWHSVSVPVAQLVCAWHIGSVSYVYEHIYLSGYKIGREPGRGLTHPRRLYIANIFTFHRPEDSLVVEECGTALDNAL